MCTWWGNDSDGAIRAEYERAHEVARQAGVHTLKLRAATSLARLWSRPDRCKDARALLQPVYGWFSEGFDTPDMKVARSLVDDLS